MDSVEEVISVLVPTRKRRLWLHRFMGSVVSFADRRDLIEFVIYIDQDDDSYNDLWFHPNTTIVRGPRILMSEMWNVCWRHATGNIFMHAGDDVVVRTQGWDTMVRETFAKYPDGIVFVHGNDGLNDATLGTHGFVSRKWTDVTGTFLPPYFTAEYNDTWLTDVANRIDRHVYLPDLSTEHLHWVNGKAEMDETYKDTYERRKVYPVDAVYQLLEPVRAYEARMLKAAMQ